MFNYNIAKHTDKVTVLQDLFNGGTLKRTKNGTIKIESTLPPSSNWMRCSNNTMGKHCYYLWAICFSKFGFIHSQCRNCYKVVANLKSFEEMMQVVDVQKKMDVPSKVGIDDRPYTTGQYGAYWYNEGLEAGLEKLEVVRAELKPLGITDIFLKRACTEYENACGDSAYWDSSPQVDALEKELDDLFEFGDFSYTQTDWVDNNIMIKWVEFAHARGDMSYLPYRNGVPLTQPYRTYEPGCKHPEEMIAERLEEMRRARNVQEEE
jgi:hypothetical protein